jgi:enamine deaminase RidA (YjgF/YER057c/UK114 family)
MTVTIESRLLELGIELPAAPLPVGNYLPYRRAGDLLYISGQGPRDESGKISIGKVGQTCTVEQAFWDARRVGIQILSIIKQAAQSLDNVEAIVKLVGMVNATPDFTDHPRVINGCSDLLVEVLGERGAHARSAVGMGSLPHGMTVEVEAIIQLKS